MTTNPKMVSPRPSTPAITPHTGPSRMLLGLWVLVILGLGACRPTTGEEIGPNDREEIEVQGPVPIAIPTGWEEKRVTVRIGPDTVVFGQADPPPPDRYIDDGVCPGECCIYREWTGSESLQVYAAPGDINGSIAFDLPPGKPFEALTGQVIFDSTGVALMHRDYPVARSRDTVRVFAAGDSVRVLTDLGENHYRYWYRGEIVIDYDCWTSTTRPACELVRAPVSRWWVQIKAPDRAMGWIDMSTEEARTISGVSVCG